MLSHYADKVKRFHLILKEMYVIGVKRTFRTNCTTTDKRRVQPIFHFPFVSAASDGRPQPVVGDDVTVCKANDASRKTNTSHHPHGYVPANIPSYPTYTLPLFREKDGTKKLPGAQTPPQELTRLPMSKHLARQSATFCRFVYVTKWGFAMVDCLPPASTQSDIGECNPTFIL